MAVRSIGRKEFNRLFPYTGELTPFIGEGVEWFTDDGRRAVGIVGRSSSQPAWRYAVLKRSQFGNFRVTHLGEASADLPTIRDQCRRAVAAAEHELTAAPAPEVAGSQTDPTLEFPEKPRSSLAVVVLILAADVVVIAIIVSLIHHWL